MKIINDDSAFDYYDEPNISRHYRNSLSKSPKCNDPDHPGCNICEYHEYEDTYFISGDDTNKDEQNDYTNNV